MSKGGNSITSDAAWRAVFSVSFATTWQVPTYQKFCFKLPANVTYILPCRWKRIEEDQYIGVYKDAVWELVQGDTSIQYKSHRKRSKNLKDDAEVLKNYCRLDVNLPKLYQHWSDQDPNFKKAAEKFYGVRMLHQDVIENVFSFICSSNNNIAR